MVHKSQHTVYTEIAKKAIADDNYLPDYVNPKKEHFPDMGNGKIKRKVVSMTTFFSLRM